MKRILTTVILMFVFLSSVVIAQVPQNNLGKTVSSLRQIFPNLRYSKSRGDLTEYVSDGITFTFKNNKVVAECMGVNEGRKNGYDWFNAMMKSFENTSYTRATQLSSDSMSLTRTFYFPNFWITLCYWKDDGYTTITYQNSDYFK